jgi:adenine-specific DNA-methyltransferase
MTQDGTKDLDALFGAKLFGFPKPVSLIKYLIKITSQFMPDAIIMDFFSGSATTAHAVMQLNAEDGGNRKFIMVQLPETTDEKSEAYKAGYKNICEIGKERIRRAGAKIKEELNKQNQQIKLGEEPKPLPDIGFRVLKLDSSNMKDVYYTPTETTQIKIEDLADNIKQDRTPEDLLFQVMLELGVLPSSAIKEMRLGGKCVFSAVEGSCWPALTAILTRLPSRKSPN